MRLATGGVTIGLLDWTHRVDAFECGEAARDAWLRSRALANQRSDDTRTYVALAGAEVVGFYALAVGSVVRGSLPGPMRRNAADPVGCVLLAQIAVASRHQGRGIGRTMMLHAMTQAVRVAEIAGCRLFAVHPARAELTGYYQRYEFVSVDSSPALMAMSLRKARFILAAVAGGRAAGVHGGPSEAGSGV